MRHVPIPRSVLLAEIEAIEPKWLEKAAAKTAADRAAGRQISRTTLWSSIKPIFVTRQREKCAYCERYLGQDGIEWDMEHFRPKRKVIEWRSTEFPRLRTGGADDRGYYLLAYEPSNYLASCKRCNTRRKANFFPIARKRRGEAATATEARPERPYLLNPVDPDETPPETLIGFRGSVPRAIGDSKESVRRATITIEVLGLKDREDLQLIRAEVISQLWFALESRDSANPRRAEAAVKAIRALTGPGARMSRCAVCFHELYVRDRDSADKLGEAANDYHLGRTG